MDPMAWIERTELLRDRVGPFRFGANISRYVRRGLAALDPELEPTHWDDDGSVWVEYRDDTGLLGLTVDEASDRIEVIECRDRCYYNGRDLIGMSRFELSFVLGEPDDEELFDFVDHQQVYLDYESAGVSVWLENDEVVTVSCFGPGDDG